MGAILSTIIMLGVGAIMLATLAMAVSDEKHGRVDESEHNHLL